MDLRGCRYRKPLLRSFWYFFSDDETGPSGDGSSQKYIGQPQRRSHRSFRDTVKTMPSSSYFGFDGPSRLNLYFTSEMGHLDYLLACFVAISRKFVYPLNICFTRTGMIGLLSLNHRKPSMYSAIVSSQGENLRRPIIISNNSAPQKYHLTSRKKLLTCFKFVGCAA